MKLAGFQSVPNFGDVLAEKIFPRYLGNILQRNDGIALLGIGTIITPEVSYGKYEVILGAGAGYKKGRYSIRNRRIYALRGPLSAELLRVDPQLAAIDSGILASDLPIHETGESQSKRKVIFVPHWQTHQAAGNQWGRVCEQNGIEYISPLSDCFSIIAKIKNAELILAEALHVTIVAQSFKKPWLPLILGSKVLEFKWQDWCKSIGIKYNPCCKLPPLLGEHGPMTSNAKLKKFLFKMGIGKRKWQYIQETQSDAKDEECAARALNALQQNPEQWLHFGNTHMVSLGKEKLLNGIDALKKDYANGKFAAI